MAETSTSAWNRKDFAHALINPGSPTPPGVTARDDAPAHKRFNVYRNNIAQSLIEALGDSFPAVKHQAGDARFCDLAQLYASAHPPLSPLLFEYGADFADFIDTFAPAREQMPWLAGLARLERAWLDAYHAADSAPLDGVALAAIPGEALAGITFVPHPAMTVISAPYAIHDLFEQYRSGASPVVLPPIAQCVLITRPALQVETRLVTKAQAEFFKGLKAGVSLGDAAGQAMEVDPDFDMAGTMTMLIISGAFTGLAAPDPATR